MTTATAHRLIGPTDAFWDVAYLVAIVGLGIAATAAVWLQISGA